MHRSTIFWRAPITTRRPYNLGKRRAGVEATRARIVEAAVACYQEHGISGTSMQEVARRADVAAGTVLYHFKTPDDLARMVIDELIVRLGVPGPAVLEGAGPVAERVRRAVDALMDFFERSAPWLGFFQRDMGRVQVLDEAEAENYHQRAALVREAIAPARPTPSAAAAAVALTQPEMIGALMRAGEAYESVRASITRMVLGVLAHDEHEEER
jgi:AcrR family transcriptional regulator